MYPLTKDTESSKHGQDTAVWTVTLSCSVHEYQRFGGPFCLHLLQF
jgi:hypothetical protein